MDREREQKIEQKKRAVQRQVEEALAQRDQVIKDKLSQLEPEPEP